MRSRMYYRQMISGQIWDFGNGEWVFGVGFLGWEVGDAGRKI